jgi:Na+-transporting NADH:ubiquinone oxidoreductase subunit A
MAPASNEGLLVRIGVRTGLDLSLAGAPHGDTIHVKEVVNAAILGRDFPGVRFDLLVEQGCPVRSGEALLRDRHRPDIVFTSPISGTLGSINRGARRTLVSLTVVGDETDAAVSFDVDDVSTREQIRQLMLKAGLWPAIKTRPFGHVADPAGEPKALLVTAMESEPLAPDPALVIAAHPSAFRRGLDTLSNLTDAPVYLCRAVDADVPSGDSEALRVAEFHGPHPAGLPGVHIHALCPIGFDGLEVWHIGYQDVIALGMLMETGRPWLQRIISLAGPAVENPRLMTVPLGAAVDEVVAGELEDDGARVISGSILSGHVAFGTQAYLGRYHRQITALPEAPSRRSSPWRAEVTDTSLGGEPGPLIPIGDFEQVAPPGVLPVPLLRALLVGDVDRARELGALELVEEDVMLLSYVCPSKTDYGGLLRGVLDQLHEEAS